MLKVAFLPEMEEFGIQENRGNRTHDRFRRTAVDAVQTRFGNLGPDSSSDQALTLTNPAWLWRKTELELPPTFATIALQLAVSSAKPSCRCGRPEF